MGNKLGSCGCNRETLGYADSPYSKQMSKNLIRFWAEIFLLAQEGKSPSTKWQMVVPKLVPVNLARVQDTPVVVAHVTAYNTKVDKVMDTLIYHPGVELFRGSDCFVYWCDPQNGLTWGLNFITSEDATYFVDIVCGRSKGVLCRRANSTQSLTSKQQTVLPREDLTISNLTSLQTPQPSYSMDSSPTPLLRFYCQKHGPPQQPQRPTSIPTSPEMNQRSNENASVVPGIQRKHSQRPTVTFADQATTINPPGGASVPGSPKMCPVHGPRIAAEMALASSTVASPPHSEILLPKSSSGNSSIGCYDNLSNYWSKQQQQLQPSIETIASGDFPSPAVWQKQELPPEGADVDDDADLVPSSKLMQMSLDSDALKKLIDPITAEIPSRTMTPPVGLQEKYSSPQARKFGSVAFASADSASKALYGEIMKTPSVATKTLYGEIVKTPSAPNISRRMSTDRSSENQTKNNDHQVQVDDGGSPSTTGGSGSFDNDNHDVVLKQNDRQISVVTTPKMKRSSIHLVATRSGHLRSTEELASAKLSSVDDVMMVSMKELDETVSLNSSAEGSTTSQQSANRECPPPANHAIRKSGYILMKKWLQSHPNNIVAVVTNEIWKRYWCCLKGVFVYFYTVVPLDDKLTTAGTGRRGSGTDDVRLSDHFEISIDLYQCLAQPVPEYPRREHVFCLTNGNGESYLLQVTSENDLDGWIQAVHTASAMALARSNNHDAVVKTLKREIDRLEQKIEMVSKMIKLCQLPSVSNVQQSHQLDDWEDEFELLHIQNYMTKCYLAVLKNHDCPSCKKLLSAATKTTKDKLSQLGAFTSSSMHAYVLAKSNAKFRRSASPAVRPDTGFPSSDNPTAVKRTSVEPASSSSSFNDISKTFKSHASLVQVALPNQQIIVVRVCDMDTVAAVVQKACEKASLKADQCFMLLKRLTSPNEVHVPEDEEPLQAKMSNYQVELRERLVYHVHLSRSDTIDNVFGLTIRAQKSLITNLLTVSVSNVDDNGLAKRVGLASGDELLAINGLHVKRLTPLQVEQILQDCSTLCLVGRTKRLSLPAWLEPVAYREDSLKLPCGPQGQTNVSCVELSTSAATANVSGGVGRTAAAVDEDDDDNWFSDSCRLLQHKVKYRTGGRHPSLVTRGRQRYSLPVIPSHANYNLLNSPPNKRESFSAHSSPQQINHFDQRYGVADSATNSSSYLLKRISSSEPGGIMMTIGQTSGGLSNNSNGSVNGISNGNNNNNNNNGKMAPNERLEKILFELMQTEKAYVQDLDNLIRTYLEPLMKENVLPTDDIRRLTAACSSITRFQRTFYEEIQEAVNPGCSSDTGVTYGSPSQLRNALLRLGGVFLNSAVGFKVYSSFCASYLRVQKLLRNEEQNESLQRFLSGCNVKRQHSSTLESYLIKPVQRVLRYPLFLQQMKSLTGHGTPENGQIGEALTKMEKVAEYINEMQRIYEEYGLLFDQAQTFGKSMHNSKINFDVCELLMFGEVDWLNFNEENGNRRKAVPLECLCFVFKSAVLISADRQKNKKTKINSGTEKLNVCRIIPVNELEINGSDVGSSDTQFIWILIHMDPVSSTEKIFYFSSRRLEVKQQFLKAIRKAGVLMSKNVQPSVLSKSQTPVGFQQKIHSQNSQYFSSSSAVSSPDSGLPQTVTPTTALPPSSAIRRPMGAPSNGHATTSGQSASSGKPSTSGSGQNSQSGQSAKRPISHHSNQSDPGYGSNSELQRRL